MEGFKSKKNERAPQEERFEVDGSNYSPEEVRETISEDSEALVNDGAERFEEIAWELPEGDPAVASARERLANIAGRARELAKWTAAGLALSFAQPSQAQEAPPQDEAEIVVTATPKPYKLKINNPQREGYTTPEAYRRYLDSAWETLRKPYVPAPEVFSLDTIAEDIYQKKLEELTPEEREGVEIRYSSQKPRRDKVTEEQHGRLKEFEETIKPSFDKERNLSDAEIQKQSAEYQEALSNLDDQREWLAGVVHSPEYKRRLVVNEKINEMVMGEDDEEYGSDKRFAGMPKDPLERRRYRATQDALRVSDIQHPIANKDALGEWTPRGFETDNPNLLDRAVIDKVEAVKPESKTGVHELEHHVTEGNEGITPAAKWLYGRAFNTEHILNQYPDLVEYFSDPTELDARKKEFEYELERLTDWRYGEPFTPKLLEQVRKLQKEGKFKDESDFFLELIKPGYIMRIMNTLAENEPVPTPGSKPDQRAA